jgi:hypothetical protein
MVTGIVAIPAIHNILQMDSERHLPRFGLAQLRAITGATSFAIGQIRKIGGLSKCQHWP